MFSKSKVALVAAFVVSSASVALADEHFDVNIYRPVPQSPAFATYMGALSAYAQVPVAHAAPSADESRLFAKGSYAGW
jgi:hypothetical protein